MITNNPHRQLHPLPTNNFVLVMTLHDQIGNVLGGFDEFVVHGTDRGGVLGDDFGEGASAFDDVALDSSH